MHCSGALSYFRLLDNIRYALGTNIIGYTMRYFNIGKELLKIGGKYFGLNGKYG